MLDNCINYFCIYKKIVFKILKIIIIIVIIKCYYIINVRDILCHLKYCNYIIFYILKFSPNYSYFRIVIFQLWNSYLMV